MFRSRRKLLPIGVHWTSQHVTLAQLRVADGTGSASTTDGDASAPVSPAVEIFALADTPWGPTGDEAADDARLAQIIRGLYERHGFRGRRAVSCLGAEELFLHNVRLPKLPPDELEKVIRWEADERLPYPVAEAELRYIVAAQVRQDADVKQEVILLSCHHGVLDRRIRILEAAGLEPAAFDIEPCAVLRTVSGLGDPTAAGEQPTSAPQRAAIRSTQSDILRAPLTVAVHIGTASTTVMCADADTLLFLKYIQLGGRQLDAAVAASVELPPEDAERVRSGVMMLDRPDLDNEIHRAVLDAVTGPLDALAGEVQLCLRYLRVTFRGRSLQRFVLTGLEASPWTAHYLGRRLGVQFELSSPLEVVRPAADVAEALNLSAERRRSGRWAPALGLALRSVAASRGQI